jgi:outer membrane receptor for ferrienterochelin and colicin
MNLKYNHCIAVIAAIMSSATLYAQGDTTRSEEVNIKVYRNSRSEGALTNDIRSAGLVLSGISSERIGSLQVTSANDVVRKITGVTVMDDGKLVIRGVSPRYNVVLLDGFKAPSFDPDVRLFSLDVLPANVLDNIKVVKSPSAEYPSDFSGGIVNIETLSLPDKNEWRAQITLGGDFQTLGNDFLSQTQTQSKLFGFNQKANALPNKVAIDHMDRIPLTVNERIEISNQLGNNFYPETRNLVEPNWKLQIQRTNRLKLKKGKAFFGSSHLATMENTYESRTLRRSSIMTNPFVARIINFSDQTYLQTMRASLLNNFTYGSKSGLRMDLKTLYVNNAEYGVMYRQGKALPGAYGENGIYEDIAFKQYTTNNTFRRFFIGSFNVKVPLKNEKYDLNFGVSTSISRFTDQDRKSTLQTRDDNPTGATTTANFAEDFVATMDQLRFGRWFYDLPENMYQAKADFK